MHGVQGVHGPQMTADGGQSRTCISAADEGGEHVVMSCVGCVGSRNGSLFITARSCSEHLSQHLRLNANCVQSVQRRTASNTRPRVSVEMPDAAAPGLPHITTVVAFLPASILSDARLVQLHHNLKHV